MRRVELGVPIMPCAPASSSLAVKPSPESVTEQSESCEPPSQQRVARGRRRRPLGSRGGSGRGGHRGDGWLPAGGVLVGDGGAVVQLGADETATPPDVVHAPQGPPGEGLGEGEAGGVVLQDGGDALVAKATVHDVLGWEEREKSLTCLKNTYTLFIDLTRCRCEHRPRALTG